MTMSRAIPLYNRQKQLLALLHEIRSKTGKRDFQKLLFLYCQESNSTPPYEFVLTTTERSRSPLMLTVANSLNAVCSPMMPRIGN